MNPHESQPPQRIRDRLRARSLLVTGSTGLLAKVFVEKLLRSVPNVGRIHLLVRRRSDGMTSRERVKREVLGSSVFDRMRALLGPRFEALCLEKIHVVEGDLTQDRFGLSPDEYEALTKQIDIVVNSAATVTFDERLDVARSLNAMGPTRMLQFAKDCGNIPFMQVSTCYVSGRRSGDIPEALLPPPDGGTIDLDSVLSEMGATCDRILNAAGESGESQRKQLIAAGMDMAHRHAWNDTYTFTKWMGEQLVNRNRGDVPVTILRPAIIEGSYEEPVPGWIDGLRMADPMIIAYGRGTLTEFPGIANVPLDVIPVDVVANAMVAALEAPGAAPGLKILQVCSSYRSTVKVAEMLSYMEQGFRRRPMLDDDDKPIPVRPLRLVSRADYERTWQKRLERAHRARNWLGRMNVKQSKKRQLGSVIARIEQLLYFGAIYSPYTHLDCRFEDKRLCDLRASLHPDDQVEFAFDSARIDWQDYIVNRHVPGLRKFVLAMSRSGQRPIPLPHDAMPDDTRVERSIQDQDTIFEAFEHTARLCGEKIALQMMRRGRWVRYTYEDALGATASVARRFGEHGLVPGERVAICGESSPAWGLTYLAAMRAGLTAIPLDPQLPGAEVLACCRFAGARLICAGATTIEAIRQAAAEVSGREGSTPPIVEMTEPFVPPPGASRDAPPPSPRVHPDQVASILFTSGTTIAPKAVQLSHANLLSNARAIVASQPLGARDNFLSVLPMYHAFEFTAGFMVPITAGATITYVDQLKGPAIMEAMRSTRTTVMLVVPRMLKLFYDSIQRKVEESGRVARSWFKAAGTISDVSQRRLARVAFSRVHRQFGGHLRLFVSGGSALDPELHKAFGRLGFIVSEGYGLTETSPVLTVNPPDGGKPGSVGKALPGIELEIREPNAEGVGELWARGPSIMRGYLNNPEATSTVLQGGWFRTGDLCKFDEDGYLYVVGRAKDTIVTDAGKNVYPDEVEARYRELPYVKELCVLGIPSPGGAGESVQAVIVADYERASDLDPPTVERTIREAVSLLAPSVPSHQRIQAVHFWRRELPKTSTLKAKRGEVRAMLLGTRLPRAAGEGGGTGAREAKPAVGELTPAQEYITRIAARITNKSVRDIHGDSSLLMDLGLDSLMKLYVVAEIEAGFGIRCPEAAVSRAGKMADLFLLVGDRKPLTEKVKQAESWRTRLHRDAPAEPEKASNGNGDWSSMPARWAARGGVSLFFHSYIRVKATGLENVPEQGPFIIAANHSSHLDGAAVVRAIGGRRKVWIAAAEDYFFDTRFKSWVFGRLFDAIPFDRHSEGVAGLQRCIGALDRGDGLLVMPEGTRSTNGHIQPFKVGAAVMAIETNAPVIPALIQDAHHLLPKGSTFARPGVVRVAFGPPIRPDRWQRTDDIAAQYIAYREMTAEIQAGVEGLVRTGRHAESAT